MGASGAHGPSGPFGIHGLTRPVPLATNCWPEAPRAGGGGGGSTSCDPWSRTSHPGLHQKLSDSTKFARSDLFTHTQNINHHLRTQTESNTTPSFQLLSGNVASHGLPAVCMLRCASGWCRNYKRTPRGGLSGRIALLYQAKPNDQNGKSIFSSMTNSQIAENFQDLVYSGTHRSSIIIRSTWTGSRRRNLTVWVLTSKFQTSLSRPDVVCYGLLVCCMTQVVVGGMTYRSLGLVSATELNLLYRVNWGKGTYKSGDDVGFPGRGLI